MLVGVGVGEALDLTGVAAEDAVKVGTDLVAFFGFQVVALGAAGFEEVGAFLGVA